MGREFLIDSRTGKAFAMGKGERVTVVDVEGRQVADFFAVNAGQHGEFLSTGVTIDVNESLNIKKGDRLYTNLYRPIFLVLGDDVQRHDLLHPCCRPEMYDFFYQNGPEHNNCHENINGGLAGFGVPSQPIIHPFNIFMNTTIMPDGSIEVGEPNSRPGDGITLMAEMDCIVCIAACSVSESNCNGGKCTPLKIMLSE